MSTPLRFSLLAAAFVAALAAALHADVVPNPLFADHAVLQQGRAVPVWGTADEGEHVTVEIAGQRASATAGKDGRWLVRLAPLTAGGPHTMTISGKNSVVLSDVLVGEVWICSGQSNMERQLGPRPPQLPIVNWEHEVATADFPRIRHFGVKQTRAFEPVTTVEGKWLVCSPQTAADFTAVGFFFARDLFQARRVPIGLIHSSWGGTPAEAWTSAEGLRPLPDFAAALRTLARTAEEVRAGTFDFPATLAAWYRTNDAGTKATPAWSSAAVNTATWKTMQLPGMWESGALPEFDGVVWFRKTFDLPASWSATDVELHLGAIDDIDTTWVNGVQVGSTSSYNKPRIYSVPASALKPKGNVIAIRVLDTGGGGGFWGPDAMRIVAGSDEIPLSGEWLFAVGGSLSETAPAPIDYSQSPNAPSVLYNGMLAPLLPYAMRGVIWYQGESNATRARQYRTLFPNMIADWRRVWGLGDFPFLFVQIAPHHEMTPEVREAQLFTLERSPNTAMTVTIDCGDAEDIHPTNKRPVGERLALAARALAYGEKIEFSGPLFAAAGFENGKATVRFTHVRGGLVATGGPLRGFTLAGADKTFRPARAEIVGDTVAAEDVKSPVAIRYGWANVADGNLFNAAGLPASPFRSDVE